MKINLQKYKQIETINNEEDRKKDKIKYFRVDKTT